jgi:Tol biopolymer transport system component
LCFADRSTQSFSPDDRWVVYNSDVEKSDNVYLADVHSI